MPSPLRAPTRQRPLRARLGTRLLRPAAVPLSLFRVNSATITASSTTASAYSTTLGVAVSPGDVIVVACEGNGTHVTNGMSVQDSVNTTAFTTILETQGGSASSRWLQTFVYRTPQALPSGTNITFTPYAASTANSFVVDVFRGATSTVAQAAVGSSNPLGTSSAAPALAAAPPAGSLVLTFCQAGGGTLTPGSPFTVGSSTTSNNSGAVGYLLGADGTSTCGSTWTLGTSNTSSAQTVALAAATGGITEDPSAPAPVTSITTAVTTASFTPVANSLLVAIATCGDDAGGGTFTCPVTDSLGSTWTLRRRANAAGEGGSTEVWVMDAGSSPAARTVTATGTGGVSAEGTALCVKVLTGAANAATQAAQGTTGTAIVTATTAFTISVATTTVGSLVVGGLLDNVTLGALTGPNGNTSNWQTVSDTTRTERYGAFRSFSTTITPGTLTYGWTNTAADHQHLVAVEILPATGGSGATATPATVAATASITAPIIQAGAGVAPATVAGTATVDAPTVRLGAAISAATVAAVAAIDTPSVQTGGNATATPGTVSATATIGAPTEQAGSVVTAATVAGTATVPAPTVKAGAAPTPATVAGTATVGAASVSTGAGVVPATVTAVAAVAAPTVQAGAGVVPSTVATVATVGGPTIRLSVAITPATVTAVAAIPTPSLGGSVVVNPSTVAATSTIPSGTMQAGSTVAAATVAATATIPAPTVQAGAKPGPATVAAIATIGTPSVGQSTLATPVTVSAGAAIPAGTVRAGSAPTPATVSGVATVGGTTVTVGVTISAATVAAVATVPAPTVTVVRAVTYRPNTGITARPGSGITVRPFTTITPRP